MKKPNFFLIGAPKCGTTALYYYLKDHREIYFSDPKEPHYFDTDFSEAFRKPFTGKIFKDDVEYTTLFRNAQHWHKAIGEGSVWYLCSSEAAQKIQKYNPDSKIIVMLRNPVQMAPSLHAEELFSTNENIKDFKTAWHLQDARQRGCSIPKKCSDQKLVQYRNACMLGSQMKRLFTVFPREQIMPIIFDDFVSDVRKVYEDVLSFLGVSFDNRTYFPVINERKDHLFKFLNYLLLNNSTPYFLIDFSRTMKRILGIKSFYVRPMLKKFNTIVKDKDKLDLEFRMELLESFSDDIGILEEILGRNLDSWRKVA